MSLVKEIGSRSDNSVDDDDDDGGSSGCYKHVIYLDLIKCSQQPYGVVVTITLILQIGKLRHREVR